MRKKVNKLLTILLALTIFLNSFNVVYASEENKTSLGSDASVEMEVEGTDSVGEMLASEIQTQKDERFQNEGNCIMSLKFEGEDKDDDQSSRNVACVSFSVKSEAQLIVGVYDENHIQMLNYEKTEVNKDDTYKEIIFDIDEMPEYFTATAYLLSKENNRPLCQEYTTEMYTKEMQELEKSTVDDYAPEDVLQLDGNNKETNFAVYNNDTVVIEENEGINELKDMGNGIIEIDNADQKIIGLKQGDTLSYKYMDGSVLLIKVMSVKVDGTTVIITQSDDTDLTDYFDYIKIDADGGSGDAEIDNNNLESGVTYLEEATENAPAVGALDGDGSISASVAYKIKRGAIKGSVGLKLNFHIQFYCSLSYKYFSMETEYSNSISVEFSGKCDLTKIQLSKLTQYPIPCIKVKCQLYFVVSASGELKWEGEWKGSIGFRYDSNSGIDDKAPFYNPNIKNEIKMEGKLFLGLCIVPDLSVIDENVCKAEMDATSGLEVVGKKLIATSSDDMVHECNKCIDGKINVKIEAKAKLNILKDWKDIECKIASITLKITDFYWSTDKNEFGFRKCPHTSYKVDITAIDDNDNAVPEGEVTVYDKKTGKAVDITLKNGNKQSCVKLNDKGKQSIYLQNGSYTVKVTKGREKGEGSLSVGNRKTSKKITVQGEVSWTLSNGILRVSAQGKMPDYGWGENAAPWKTREKEIRKVIINAGITYIGESAFEGCENLVEVQIAKGIKSIGAYAFKDCERLETVEMPDSVTKIGNSVFYNCYKLTNFQLPSNIREIGERAFQDCNSIHDIILPETLKKIDFGAFICCHSLKSIKIPSSIEPGGIGGSTFWECKGLEKVEIPAVGGVMDRMFYNCVNLKEVILHEGISWIGDCAFGKCSSLETIELPESAEIEGGALFEDCTSLKKVIFKGKGITTLGTNMFKNCTSLIEIEIPDSVEYIDHSAFANCTKLSKMYFKGEMPGINRMYAFTNCNFTAYYPEGDETWDGIEEIEFQNAKIKWVPYKVANVRNADVLTEDLENLDPDESAEQASVEFEDSDMQIDRDDGEETESEIEDDLDQITNEEVSEITFEDGESIDGEESEEEDAIINEIEVPVSNAKEGGGEQNSMYTQTGLRPNGSYLFVALYDDMEEELLAASNVLYIDQKTADEAGTVSFKYKMKTNYTNPVLLIVGTPLCNIEDAQIEVDSLTANGKVQFPEISVTYDGKKLIENSDYEIDGDTWAVDAGTYLLTVTGINEYGGSVTKEYKVNQAQPMKPAEHKHVYGAWKTVRKSTALVAGYSQRTCKGCGKTEQKKLAKLAPTGSLNMTSIPLKVKQKTTALKVSGLASGDYIKVYTSSNKKIFTVTKKGKITAVKAGKAVLTVKLASGKQLKAKVKVQKGTVKTSKVTVAERSKVLKKGKSYKIKALISPLTSQEKVTYSTSNKKVATVSKTGKVVAKKKGKVVITVKSGKKNAKVTITVK